MKLMEKHPLVMIIIGIAGISLSAIFVKYSQAPSVVTALYRLMLSLIHIWAAMTAVWFLAERRFKNPLNNLAGGCVFSAVLAIDMAVLLLDMPVSYTHLRTMCLPKRSCSARYGIWSPLGTLPL